ncbi:hypothetical protein C8J57DRAFT_1258402 [Mycena rebaudengoi]|nr:hypothetical protein C8J57DRAFT_1258402 [Mycena rebaudengoi]
MAAPSAPISYADRAKGPAQILTRPAPSAIPPRSSSSTTTACRTSRSLTARPPPLRGRALRRHSGSRTHYAAGPAAYASTLRPFFLLHAPAQGEINSTGIKPATHVIIVGRWLCTQKRVFGTR